MQYNSDDIKNLFIQSLPKGRAFDFENTDFAKKVFTAFGNVDAAYLQTTENMLEGLFPSNVNYDIEDVRKQEKRYGVLINEANSLATRKMAVEDRLSYPNGILARQAASFMEYRLQRAGFDVYVHENRFAVATDSIARSGVGRSGFAKSGVASDLTVVDPESISYTETIRNYINVITDSIVNVSRSGVAKSGVARSSSYSNIPTEEQLRFTFFIGGATFPNFANVPLVRKDEFRQLILKLKPAYAKGWIITNYI